MNELWARQSDLEALFEFTKIQGPPSVFSYISSSVSLAMIWPRSLNGASFKLIYRVS